MRLVLVVVKHLLEPVEVEAVGDVLFVDLAEELVVFDCAEPVDPAFTVLGAVAVVPRHILIIRYHQSSSQGGLYHS